MPTSAFIAAVLAQETDEQFALLVEIDEASLEEPIRVCSGGENLTSNGDLYAAWPFQLEPPGEGEDNVVGRGRIRIDNVDPEIVGAIRNAAARPTIALRLVMKSAPNDVQKSWTGFTLGDPGVDPGSIDAEILPFDFGAETFPLQAFIPTRTPGLFD